MKKYIFTVIALFFCVCTFYGQITTEEDPISLGINIPVLTRNEINYKVLPPIDFEQLREEDNEEEANGMPPRFGFPHEVNYNLGNSGEWIHLDDGAKIWRLSISCQGAVSINLLYDKFWLPEGTKFFIYTPDYQHSIGAVTSYNNKGEKNNIQGFATGLIYGEQIILEYYIPAEVEEVGVISIAFVVHGYRYIYLEDNSSRNYGDSKPCNININCPEALNWYLEKNAVALIVVAGTRFCTGALINTTANDYRPLLLTAEHCLATTAQSAYPHLSFWSFLWHYESPGCVATGDINKPLSTTGGAVKAYNAYTDFALIELSEDPLNKRRVTPYYLGWDATGNQSTSGVGIHHPKGDIKKLCFSNQIQNYEFFMHWDDGSISSPNTHWKVAINKGTTERGSSGSPFINNEHRVIGQLHGGDTTCAPVLNYYGKLSVSWASNDSIQRQLKHWLDPLQTGALTMNGTFSCNGSLTINNKTYGSSTNILEDTYCTITISNATYNNGAVAKYFVQNKITINPGTIMNSGSTVLLVARGTPGSRENDNLIPPYTEEPEELYTDEEMLTSLQMAVSENEINDVDFTIFPNPNDGNFTIKIAGLKESYTLQIFNAMGLNVGEINCNEETVHVNKSDIPAGLYYVKMTIKDKIIVKKVMVH
jgi:hypothetical protein